MQVSKKHAGFMVNIDNGTATDYMDLIRYVQKSDFRKKMESLLSQKYELLEKSQHRNWAKGGGERRTVQNNSLYRYWDWNYDNVNVTNVDYNTN